MKVKAYMRVASGVRGPRIEASAKPNHRPITNEREILPTVAFAIELDIPDEMFRQAEQVIATMTIPLDQAIVAAEVVDVPR